jgi:hypothetical protein
VIVPVRIRTPGGATNRRSSPVEVKIGVKNVARELVLESNQSADEVADTISKAIRSDLGLLSLVDDKGRRIVVPVDSLAYVEIADTESRRVGFGAI